MSVDRILLNEDGCICNEIKMICESDIVLDHILFAGACAAISEYNQP